MEGGSGCYYSSSSSSSSNNNWDLHAVVRFACGGGRVPPPPSADDTFSSFLPPPAPAVTYGELPDAAWQPLPDLPGGADPAVVDELFKAFFAPSSPPPPHPQQQPPEAATNEGTTAQLQQPAAHAPPAMPQPTGGRQASSSGGLKSKRKKKQVKRVVQRVPADFVSADPWAWRKYGQKPIKGSPYPRGYYRCSSDKECKARKMVERCRTDPDTFVLIYTGDHIHPVPIHRNSLAGTSRNKQPPSTEPAAAESQQAPVAASTEAAAVAWPSPAASTSAGLSPMTTPRSPSLEYGQEEEFEEAGAGLLAEDVEMAGEEDTLLFLNPDESAMDVGGGSAVDSGAGTTPIINIVEETFVVTPWMTAAGDAIAAAAALGLWS